jgi:hypothetical protein
MATADIIEEASKPTFYTRVSFIALKVAQNVAAEDPATPNHTNRIAYAGRVLAGADQALLLSMHIAASNPTIASTLETSGGDAVPDGDIEFAMATIWDARANAFAAMET